MRACCLDDICWRWRKPGVESGRYVTTSRLYLDSFMIIIVVSNCISKRTWLGKFTVRQRFASDFSDQSCQTPRNLSHTIHLRLFSLVPDRSNRYCATPRIPTVRCRVRCRIALCEMQTAHTPLTILLKLWQTDHSKEGIQARYVLGSQDIFLRGVTYSHPNCRLLTTLQATVWYVSIKAYHGSCTLAFSSTSLWRTPGIDLTSI